MTEGALIIFRVVYLCLKNCNLIANGSISVRNQLMCREEFTVIRDCMMT
jgi:hypothetical protein